MPTCGFHVYVCAEHQLSLQNQHAHVMNALVSLRALNRDAHLANTREQKRLDDRNKYGEDSMEKGRVLQEFLLEKSRKLSLEEMEKRTTGLQSRYNAMMIRKQALQKQVQMANLFLTRELTSRPSVKSSAVSLPDTISFYLFSSR